LNRTTGPTRCATSDPRPWRFAGDKPKEKHTLRNGSAGFPADTAARSPQPALSVQKTPGGSLCRARQRPDEANRESHTLPRTVTHFRGRRWPAVSTLAVRRGGSWGSETWHVLIDRLRVDGLYPGVQGITGKRPESLVCLARHEYHNQDRVRTRAVVRNPTARPQALMAIHGCGCPDFSDSEERHVDD
jgi:hypothetical protein